MQEQITNVDRGKSIPQTEMMSPATLLAVLELRRHASNWLSYLDELLSEQLHLYQSGGAA